MALKSVDGQFTAADLPKNPPATYNSGAMVRHATLNMGLLDKKLVESIVALNENDYNTLLAEAQQAGNNLSLAVSALRLGGELLTKVS